MLWARGLWSCVCLSPRAFPSIFPMGYGGSVGLELGWPELGSQIALWLVFGAWLCLAWGSPMGYGGSVGLALGWPELGSQIACGSCLAHGCASFGALLWGAAVVLDWSLVAQNSPLPHPALRPFPHEPSGVLSWGSPQWGGPDTGYISDTESCEERRETHSCSLSFLG